MGLELGQSLAQLLEGDEAIAVEAPMPA
jgi:hypothetical protein